MTRLALLAGLALGLSSCALVRAPLRVGGGLVKGTAELAKAPVEAHRKRKQRKEREEAGKRKEEAAGPQAAPQGPLGDPSPADLPLPDEDAQLPPLPEEYAVPPP